MNQRNPCLLRVAVVAAALPVLAAPAIGADDAAAKIEDALSAAPPTLRETVTVLDWDGTVLQEGSGAYTCYPSPPQLQGAAPMCLDEPWQGWAQAWMNEQEFTAEGVGIAYMLAGDEGASNTDPYAEGPTEHNHWVFEGPHLMLIVPDPASLDGLSTDPASGEPYVMWKGTPYAHVMVPVGERPSAE